MTSQLEYLSIDSEALGIDVWNLVGPESDSDFKAAIESLRKSKKNFYVSSKLQINEIALINAAEQSGFEFVETQFQTSLRLRQEYPVDGYPYDYIKVTSEKELEEVLEIAESTIEHDRFSRDPRIGKANSGRRYRQYLEDSFLRPEDEIWCVRSKSTGNLLTFRSHRNINSNEVLLLLGGVHPQHKDVGLGVVSSHFCFNELKSAGVKTARTYISAANTPIINLEIGHFRFRITNTYVIVRNTHDSNKDQNRF